MILSLLCIITWAVSDVFTKYFFNEEKDHAGLKILVWCGITYFLTAVAVVLLFPSQFDIHTFGHKFMLMLVPELLFFASCVCLCISMKYFECSLSSPILQISGAFTVIGYVFYYLFKGKANSVLEVISIPEISGTVFVTVGLVLLSMLLNKEDKAEKTRWRFWVLMLSLLGSLLDASSYIMESLLLSGDFEESLNAAEDCVVTGLIFGIAAVVGGVILYVKEKKVYNPFRKSQMPLVGCALGETIGTFLCIAATEQNALVAIPVTSAYGALTVLLARIFLKEKLGVKKYLCIFAIIAGIIMLSFGDI